MGCGPGPWWEVLERQPHTDVSLPFFLLPFLSLKINKYNLKKFLMCLLVTDICSLPSLLYMISPSFYIL